MADSLDRRTFLKLTAATGTSAAIAGCGVPQETLIRFVPDEDIVPGLAEWKPGVCPGCASGCGLHVRVMDADVETVRNGQRGVVKMLVAKKLEGHPAHPVNQGALCARGQATIQMTYHPDRIAQPLERSGDRGSGRFQPIAWDTAIARVVERLDTLAASGDQRTLAWLTRDRAGQRSALVARFLRRFGAPPAVPFEAFDDAVLRRANELSFGRAQLPTFDLGRSAFALSFGADVLGTWNSPVAHNAAYGRMRQGRPGVRGTFVQIESRMSQTGASADEWIAIRPGADGALALGLARVLIADGLRPANRAGPAGALIDGWAGGLAAFTPDRVERQTGVAASRVVRLAHALAERGPAVAMIGGAPLAHSNGLFNALAVNALNALVGSVGQPGGVFFTPRVALNADPASSASASDAAPRSLAGLAAGILGAPASPVQALIVDGANPVFAAPLAWKVREAFDRIPFIVSFGGFLDETSALADLILPDHSFLESWVEAIPESGSLAPVVSVAPPAMKPLHQTRAMPDVLLEIARALKQPLSPPLPWQTFEEMLSAAFSTLPAAPGGDDAWTAAQKQGGWWGAPAAQDGSSPASPAASAVAQGFSPADRGATRRQPIPVAFTEPQFDGPAGEFPFHFLPYASTPFGDGSLAHLPWLQELPDPLTSAMWSSWIEVNPKTAGRLGLAQGDVVEIASRHGSIRAPVAIFPGIAPDVVAMPVGQGHRMFTRVASGRGSNPIEILAPLVEKETGALAWAATRVKLTRVAGGRGELILFAGEMHEHPHEHER